MTDRNKDGTFKRKRNKWTPEQWDDGYLDNRNRFRVYRPDYPRCYAEGYALRYHVVWWLETGKVHPKGTEIHHKDLTKFNDAFSNLEVLSNSEHQRKHKSVTCKCAACGKMFYRAKHRIRYGSSYCSFKCYQLIPKSNKTRMKVSQSLKAAYREGRR